MFNIGSGHKASEVEQTIGALGMNCSCRGNQHSITTDGVVVLGGGYAAYFTSRLNETVQAILTGTSPAIIQYFGGGVTRNRCRAPLAPGDTVNLTGHSRGAAMCHLIANRLATQVSGIKLNICVLDPVNMTRAYATESSQLNAAACNALQNYRIISMLNERSSIFPLKLISLANNNKIGVIKPLGMPGTHGTGTLSQSTAVGKATMETIRYYMTRWGTKFISSVPQDGEFCDLYARIHLESLRTSKPQAVMVQGKAQKFSPKRATAVGEQWTNNPEWKQARTDLNKRPFRAYFPDSYFINRFHENRFRHHFRVHSFAEFLQRQSNLNVSQTILNSINLYQAWAALR